MAAKTLSVTIAAKKIEGTWEAAVVSDGKFSRALTGKDLDVMVMKQVRALLAVARPDETNVQVIITVEDGPEPGEKVDSEEKKDGQS